MAIPKSFVERNLEKAKGSQFFGVPIDEMTRDELIACCVAGWQGQDEQRKEHARRLDFLGSLRRA
jgi:hypothetical protein